MSKEQPSRQAPSGNFFLGALAVSGLSVEQLSELTGISCEEIAEWSSTVPLDYLQLLLKLQRIGFLLRELGPEGIGEWLTEGEFPSRLSLLVSGDEWAEAVVSEAEDYQVVLARETASQCRPDPKPRSPRWLHRVLAR